MTVRFSIVLMILVGIAIAYYGSWVRPLWSLGAVLAWLGLPYVPRGADFVAAALAFSDVALVFVVYKGDIRIR